MPRWLASMQTQTEPAITDESREANSGFWIWVPFIEVEEGRADDNP
jgi:hypothetical protein